MQIEIEPKTDHLYAVISGPFDHAKLEGVLKEIFTTGSRHGLRKVLIDIKALEGEIPVMARHDAGEIAASFRTEVIRLAILGTETQIWPDRFFENVANNRGLATKVTTDLAEALEWLRK